MSDGKDTKRCGRCKRHLGLEKFGKVKGRLRSYCRTCHDAWLLIPDSRKDKPCGRCKITKTISEFYRSKNHYQSHCKQCRRELAKHRLIRLKQSGRASEQYRQDYINRRKWAKLQKHYGLTKEDYEAMLAEQNGLCAICRQLEMQIYRGAVLMLTVDHDHKTGRVRGLVCKACNFGLGKFRDDPELIQRALDYILQRRLTWRQVSLYP